MKDVISMRDFTKEEIINVLDAAQEVKEAIHDASSSSKFKEKYGREVSHLLEGIKVASLFTEVSTRTNFSFRAAAGTAQAFVDGFPSEDHTALKKGETWADTAAMFAGWGYQTLIMRSTTEGLPRWTKEFLERNHNLLANQHKQFNSPFSYIVPQVINGGDGKNQHPSQCFTDLFTKREVARARGKDLEGLVIAQLNDIAYSRVHSSIMSIAPLFNFELHFAYPPRFGPRPYQLEDLRRKGVKFYDHGQNMEEALKEVFIAYHSRPQKERVGKGEDFEAIKKWGMITKERYDELGEKAPYLMHPRPVDSENFEEIHHSMRFHPKNIANFQASNGLYVRIALLALGLGRMKIEEEAAGAKGLTETTLEELPLSEGAKEIRNPRSGFIQGEGVVLDHLPAGMGRRLEGVLGFEKERLPIVPSYNTPVDAGRHPLKDMVKIHCAYPFSPEQYQAMALIAPEITVNFIEKGRVVKKIRPVLGDYIKGRVKCGNEACVTNVEKEHVNPFHHIEEIEGEKILRCHYCEVADTVPQIYKENRFVYIGEEGTKGY